MFERLVFMFVSHTVEDQDSKQNMLHVKLLKVLLKLPVINAMHLRGKQSFHCEL